MSGFYKSAIACEAKQLQIQHKETKEATNAQRNHTQSYRGKKGMKNRA